MSAAQRARLALERVRVQQALANHPLEVAELEAVTAERRRAIENQKAQSEARLARIAEELAKLDAAEAAAK